MDLSNVPVARWSRPALAAILVSCTPASAPAPAPALASAQTPSSPAARVAAAGEPDVIQTVIDVSVSPPSPEIRETAHFLVRRLPSAPAQIEFSLGLPFSVQSALVDGAPARIRRNGTQIALDLPPTPGSSDLRVDLRFEGAPSRSAHEDRPVVTADSVFLLWSDAWYPLREDDWSPVTLIAHLPPEFPQVVGPGEPSQSQADGGLSVTHRFVSRVPLVNFSLFSDRRWELFEHAGCGGRCAALLYPAERSYASRILASERDVVDFYGSTFLPYPYGRFSFAEIDGIYARRALAGFVAYTPKYLRKTFDSTGFDAHETALEWFGYMLGGTWIEWFGDYAENLYVESRHAMLDPIFARFQQQYLSLPEEKDRPLSVLSGGPQEIVHGKGPRVVRLLRQLLGEQTFRRTMRCLFDRYAFAKLDVLALQPALEKCSGRPLATFFADWVNGTGLPSYELEWSATPNGENSDVRLVLHQAGRVFRTPVEVEIRTDGGAKRVTIAPNSGPSEGHTRVRGRVTHVVLDPDDWVFKRSVRVNPGKRSATARVR